MVWAFLGTTRPAWRCAPIYNDSTFTTGVGGHTAASPLRHPAITWTITHLRRTAPSYVLPSYRTPPPSTPVRHSPLISAQPAFLLPYRFLLSYCNHAGCATLCVAHCVYNDGGATFRRAFKQLPLPQHVLPTFYYMDCNSVRDWHLCAAQDLRQNCLYAPCF